MKLRLEKKGIRALGICESFRKNRVKSVLSGVVMRSDLVVDGFIFGSATIEGDDATAAIIDMFRRLNRNDINVTIICGAVISMYNIIDFDRVCIETQAPVVSISFKESEGLEENIMHRFKKNPNKKLDSYRKLGVRQRVKLKTGYKLYVRPYGVDIDQAKKALDKFTLQGSIPEPIKLAKLLSRAKLESDDMVE